MPASQVKISIAKVLKEEGYVFDYQVEQTGKKSLLIIKLKYHNGSPVIDKIKRISKPGLRIYRSCEDLPKVVGG